MAFTGDIDGVWLIQQMNEYRQKVRDHTFPRLEEDEDDDGDPALRCPWCRGVVRSDGLFGHYHDYDETERTQEYGDETELMDDKVFWLNVDNKDVNYGLVYFTHSTCDNPVSLPEKWGTEWV